EMDGWPYRRSESGLERQGIVGDGRHSRAIPHGDGQGNHEQGSPFPDASGSVGEMMRPLAFLVALACVCLAAPPRAQQPSKPTIVLIQADDLGYGDLSVYGQAMFQTPNVDRLARNGLRFISYYAGSTVCAPSRAALMTGLHTGHSSIRGNLAGNSLRP